VLDYETAAKFLHYNPDTGDLTWLHNKGSRVKAGDIAGTTSKGYVRVFINGKQYLAHRVCWLLYYGEWPSDDLDHINHKGTDNKINNLRSVSHADNMKNSKLRADNSSGVCGVSWNSFAGKWESYISVEGKRKHLGRYDDIEEAILMRMLANEKYGFHQEHGLPTQTKHYRG